MIGQISLINPRQLIERDDSFSVKSIPGLYMWFDASDATTLFQDSGLTTPATANGDPIGGWVNKEGTAARNVTQTLTARPTLATASQNGLNTLSFDGVNDVLLTATNVLAGLPGVTMFIAFKLTTTGAFVTIMGVEVTAKVGKSNTNVPFSYSSSTGSGWTSQINGSSINANWHVNSFVTASPETYARLDSVSYGTPLASGPATLGSNSNRFGIMGRIASEFGAGNVAEVLVYQSNLSGPNVVAIENYLRAKWAI